MPQGAAPRAAIFSGCCHALSSKATACQPAASVSESFQPSFPVMTISRAPPFEVRTSFASRPAAPSGLSALMAITFFPVFARFARTLTSTGLFHSLLLATSLPLIHSVSALSQVAMMRADSRFAGVLKVVLTNWVLIRSLPQIQVGTGNSLRTSLLLVDCAWRLMMNFLGAASIAPIIGAARREIRRVGISFCINTLAGECLRWLMNAAFRITAEI